MEKTEISQNKQTTPITANTITPPSKLNKSPHKGDLIDFVFGILTFLLGYSYIKLIFTAWDSAMGYVIFTLLFIALSVGYLFAKKKNIPKNAIVYYCLSFLAVLPLGLYQKNSFSWISILFTMLLAVYSVTVACGVRVQDKLGDFLLKDLCNSFCYRPFGNFGVQFHSIFMVGKEKSTRKKIVTVLLAIFISIVVFFIAIGTLSNVDDNFKKIADAIIDSLDFSQILDEVPYLFLTVPVSLYLFAMFYSGVNNHNVSKYSEKEIIERRTKRKPVQQILFVLPMLVLILVYIVFFISHTMTLGTAINEGGIVYSEYARQGFFELCQISALNILICLGAMAFCKNGEKLSKIIIILNSIIAVCTMILMITATIKLGLYVSMYGLTPKRVHAAWALFVIFAVFILLLIRQFKNYNFIKFASSIIVLSYIVLSLCGVNQIVAKYNFTNHSDGNLKEFDTSYDSYWRFDGYEYAAFPYIIEQWQIETNAEKKNAIKDYIDYHCSYYYNFHYPLYKMRVASFNIESYIAQKLIRENFSSPPQ